MASAAMLGPAVRPACQTSIASSSSAAPTIFVSMVVPDTPIRIAGLLNVIHPKGISALVDGIGGQACKGSGAFLGLGPADRQHGQPVALALLHGHAVATDRQRLALERDALGDVDDEEEP